MIRSLIAVALLFSFAAFSCSDEGEPVAVIRDGENAIAIETMWDFRLTVRHSEVGWKYSVKTADEEATEISADKGKHFSIDRHPNQTKLTIFNPLTASRGGRLKPSSNVLKLQIASDRAAITVDGVRVVVADSNFDGQNNQWLQGANALAVIGEPKDAESIVKIAKRESVGTLLLPSSASDSATEKTLGNTIALIAQNRQGDPQDKSDEQPLRVVALDDEPYELSDELKNLFQRKEAACRASQAVFEKLSVKQMNFKPSNGTHTPRWNTEHMMGRELLFFSQIFHAVDPTIPVMNLNPRQMPKDYEYKHDNWLASRGRCTCP